MSLYNRSLFTKPHRPKVSKRPLIRYVLWTAFKRMLMFFGAIFFVVLIAQTVIATKYYDQVERTLPGEFVLYLPDKILLYFKSLN